jgi:uncharacterized protein (TIGR02646 family)
LIALAKGPEPEALAQNKERWTEEYAAYRRGEDVPKAAARRYADPTVQEALKAETARKCAYCESRIEHVDYPHVEHILPKVRRPELVCDWDNLTLACTRCNVAKGEYYEPQCELVNPYTDRVAGHLLFFGTHVFHRSADRGRVTVTRLDLNRPELVARRKEAIEGLNRVRDLIEAAPPGPMREALEVERDDLLRGESEYLATTNAFHAASSN